MQVGLRGYQCGAKVKKRILDNFQIRKRTIQRFRGSMTKRVSSILLKLVQEELVVQWLEGRAKAPEANPSRACLVKSSKTG